MVFAYEKNLLFSRILEESQNFCSLKVVSNRNKTSFVNKLSFASAFPELRPALCENDQEDISIIVPDLKEEETCSLVKLLKGKQFDEKFVTLPNFLMKFMNINWLSYSFEEKPLNKKCVRKRSHVCHECNITFGRLENLEQHLKKVHNVSRDYTCKTCGKILPNMKKFKLHCNIHKKKYECSICQAIFSEATLLKSHSYTHQKELMPFSCNICNKKLGSKFRLKDHMNLHSNSQFYECKVCHHKIKTHSGMVHHMKRIHKVGMRGNFKMKIPEEEQQNVESDITDIIADITENELDSAVIAIQSELANLGNIDEIFELSLPVMDDGISQDLSSISYNSNDKYF